MTSTAPAGRVCVGGDTRGSVVRTTGSSTGESRSVRPRAFSRSRRTSSSGRPMRRKIRRMLGLGVDGDGPADLALGARGQVQDFVECRHREPAVVLVRAVRQSFTRPQSPDFRQRKVFGEPAGDQLAVNLLRHPTFGKSSADIGCPTQFVFMPCDEGAVSRDDEIRFDRVSAHLDRQPVRLDGVFGTIPARTPVGDDEERCLLGQRESQRREHQPRERNPPHAESLLRARHTPSAAARA